MTSRERVLGCCERRGFDRIPIKHRGTQEVNQLIKDYYQLKNDEQLEIVLGDDFRTVEPVYIGPELKKFKDGSMEGFWGEHYKYAQFEGGTYLESVFKPFEGVQYLGDLDRSHFPTPDWFDYSTIYKQAKTLRDEGFAVVCGNAGDFDFINGISRARGMEQVLMDLIDDHPVFLEIMQARFQFGYGMHERILKEAKGLVDFVHIGEDLGNQSGQMISMDIFEKHFAPKYGEYFDMVHSYSARTIMHMCGTVWMFLERLIELGLDVYDVVQPTTLENDISSLSRNFGDNLIFMGSMDVQRVLSFGSVRDVELEVVRRLSLFPDGGLILGPAHAIQPGSPVQNILAMYRSAGSLMEDIPQWVYDIQGSDPARSTQARLF